MTQTVSLKMSAAAAPYVQTDAAREVKLQAARGEVPLGSSDLAVLFFFLAHDQDQEIKHAALQSLRQLSEPILDEIIDSADVHGKILDVIAHIHFSKQHLTEKILLHPNCLENTRVFLVEKGVPDLSNTVCLDECGSPNACDVDEDAEAAADGEVCEDEEEFKSKYQLSQLLGVSEKIKMALTGDKEWRSILLKDSNKLVSGAAVKNPRMTESEVLTLAKSKIQNDEIIRVICANKEWIKNYNIRKALVENSKTPLPAALRFMATLTEKDLAFLAKNKNVSSVITTQARRVLANKSKKR